MNNNRKREEQKSTFIECKNGCVCETTKCASSGLKQCPSCHDVLRTICSKANCKKDGYKPTMITPKCDEKCNLLRKRRMQKVIVTNDTSSESRDTDDDDEDLLTNVTSDEEYEDVLEQQDDDIDALTPGEKVIDGEYIGLYATVLGNYGDDIRINYFEKKFGKWVLKDNDKDCRERKDLLRVKLAGDTTARGFTFSD